MATHTCCWCSTELDVETMKRERVVRVFTVRDPDTGQEWGDLVCQDCCGADQDSEQQR